MTTETQRVVLKLRPLIVLTGTLRVEGGETNHGTRNNKIGPDGQSMQFVMQKRTVSADRKAANVVVVTFARTLRKHRILTTPFGNLYDTSQVAEIRSTIQRADQAVIDFHKQPRDCKLVNGWLWEILTGTRKIAIERLLTRLVRERDPEVMAALPKLLADPVPTPVPPPFPGPA